MPCYYENLGAQKPYDETDEVRQSGVGASPARSWQHRVARAIMANVLDALGSSCVLEGYPLELRVTLVSDLEKLVDTYEDDREGVTDRIFDRLFSDYAVEQDVRQAKTQHQIHEIMDEVYQLIDGNHQPLKRL